MNQSRRDILRKLSALPTLAVGASGIASAANCSGVPTWRSGVAYSGGDQIIYDGSLWEAKWWTRGTEPGSGGAWGPWTKVGTCNGNGGDGGDGGGDDGGNQSPTASFTTSDSSVSLDEVITFDASGSSDTDGTITSYEWDFGDGSTATGKTVTHTYDAEGSYTVTLTVTDDAGATATSATTVSVQEDTGGGGTGSTVFAPYDHMTTRPETTLVEHSQQAGNNAVTAAFILSDGNGNAAWDGAADMHVGEAGLAPEIQTYQDTGGTVIISFGGAVGTMIAQDTTNVAKIKSEYQKVIDTYGVSHLDFDIESVNTSAVDRRNQALSELQAENPEVKVSYTLRCMTIGLTNHGKDIVENAKNHGVELEFVNVMTMNYGWVPPSASTIKDSANGTHDDLASIFPNKSSAEIWGMVGLTPMIGVNNVGGAHELSDAREVVSFVQDTGVGLVSFWSIDRDNGGCPNGTVSATCSGISQTPYEFSHIYSQVQ
jgi:chitodextrinase